MNGRFCGEAWDAVSRYVYAARQGGSIMRRWTNDDRMMIACCNYRLKPYEKTEGADDEKYKNNIF